MIVKPISQRFMIVGLAVLTMIGMTFGMTQTANATPDHNSTTAASSADSPNNQLANRIEKRIVNAQSNLKAGESTVVYRNGDAQMVLGKTKSGTSTLRLVAENGQL